MDDEQLVEYLTRPGRAAGRRHRSASRSTRTCPDDDDERDWNWLALASWANRQYGLNTNDRELKKIGRPETEASSTAMRSYVPHRTGRRSRSPAPTCRRSTPFLADDFGRRIALRLAAAAVRRRDDAAGVREVRSGDVEGPVELINERVHAAYRRRRSSSRSRSAMYALPAERRGSARPRRPAALGQRPLPHRPRPKRRQGEGPRPDRAASCWMLQPARLPATRRRSTGSTSSSTAIAEANGHSGNGHVSRPALQELSGLVKHEFGVQLDRSKLEHLQRRRRSARPSCRASTPAIAPRFGQAERSLLLEVLDHAWKEHLYYMDHLRAGDRPRRLRPEGPEGRVQARRHEGLRSDVGPHRRAGHARPSSGWRTRARSSSARCGRSRPPRTQAAPAAQEARQAPPQAPAPQQQESRGLEPGQEVKAVEPIRNSRHEGRPQRPLPLRQRQEVQEVLRRRRGVTCPARIREPLRRTAADSCSTVLRREVRRLRSRSERTALSAASRPLSRRQLPHLLLNLRQLGRRPTRSVLRLRHAGCLSLIVTRRRAVGHCSAVCSGHGASEPSGGNRDHDESQIQQLIHQLRRVLQRLVRPLARRPAGVLHFRQRRPHRVPVDVSLAQPAEAVLHAPVLHIELDRPLAERADPLLRPGRTSGSCRCRSTPPTHGLPIAST